MRYQTGTIRGRRWCGVPTRGSLLTRIALLGLLLPGLARAVELEYYRPVEEIRKVFPSPAMMPAGPVDGEWTREFISLMGEGKEDPEAAIFGVTTQEQQAKYVFKGEEIGFILNLRILVACDPAVQLVNQRDYRMSRYRWGGGKPPATWKPEPLAKVGDECWVARMPEKRALGDGVPWGRIVIAGRQGRCVFVLSTDMANTTNKTLHHMDHFAAVMHKIAAGIPAEAKTRLGPADYVFPTQDEFARMLPEATDYPADWKIVGNLKPPRLSHASHRLAPDLLMPEISATSGAECSKTVVREVIKGGNPRKQTEQWDRSAWVKLYKVPAPDRFYQEMLIGTRFEDYITGTRSAANIGEDACLKRSRTEARLMFRVGQYVCSVTTRDSREDKEQVSTSALAMHLAQVVVKKLGEPDPSEPEPGNLPLVLTVTAYAPGHIQVEEEITIESDPQQILLSGRVLDQAGQPIPQAEVTIPEYGEMVSANDRGEFTINLEFTDGEGASELERDLVLETNPNCLVVRLEPLDVSPEKPFPPPALGEPVRVRATVLANGKPFDKRWIRIRYPETYFRDSRAAGYVSLNLAWGCDTRFYTDENGQAEISIGVPRARKDTQILAEAHGYKKFHEQLFPVRGELGFVAEDSKIEGVVTMDYGCPFPRITRLAMPELRFGDWQRERSRLKWSNPRACGNYEVLMRMPGTIRVPKRSGVEIAAGTRGAEGDQDGKAHLVKGRLQFDYDVAAAGNTELEFGLMPTMRGSDFTDLPDFRAALEATMWDVGSEYAVTKGGDYLLGGTGGDLSKAAYRNLSKGDDLIRAKKLFEGVGDFYQSVGRANRAAADFQKAARTAKGGGRIFEGILDGFRNLLRSGRTMLYGKGATLVSKGLGLAVKTKKSVKTLEAARKGSPVIGFLTQAGPDTAKAFGGAGLNIFKGAEAHSIENDKGTGITVTEGINTAIGLVEGGKGIYDALAHAGKKAVDSAEKLAVLKAVWGTTKAAHECYQEYIQVATGHDGVLEFHGGRGVRPRPFVAVVSVTNEDGYTTTRRQRLIIHASIKGSGKGEWDWSKPGLRE